MRYLKPWFWFWVDGPPKSLQTKASRSATYTERIREAARTRVVEPLDSPALAVAVLYADWEEVTKGNSKASRPDVDNVLKPILDALKGVVYADDDQVRSVTSEVWRHEQHLTTSWQPPDAVENLEAGRFCVTVFNHDLPIPPEGSKEAEENRYGVGERRVLDWRRVREPHRPTWAIPEHEE